MQQAINNIVQHLFHKNDLDGVPDHELKAFVEQYPYSIIGHYLFTQKNFDAQLGNSEEQQTTALYFHNPLWLQWLLTNRRPVKDDIAEAKNGRLPDEQQEEWEGATVDPAILEERAVDVEIIVEATNDIEIIKEQSPEIDNRQPKDDDSAAEMPSHDQLTSKERNTTEQVNDGASAKEQYVSTAWNNAPEISGTIVPGADDDIINNTEEVKPAPFMEDERPIAFQSYHTIDYFASQGIKLQAADFTKDKLGQQLKSFTEWLRSMKKLPAPASGHSEEANSDDDTRRLQVTRIAEYSIQEKEIITEAMAEVWAKQGNREKAIVVYTKLSLQNPHKNAYFAAKIDQLKVS